MGICVHYLRLEYFASRFTISLVSLPSSLTRDTFVLDHFVIRLSPFSTVLYCVVLVVDLSSFGLVWSGLVCHLSLVGFH